MIRILLFGLCIGLSFGGWADTRMVKIQSGERCQRLDDAPGREKTFAAQTCSTCDLRENIFVNADFAKTDGIGHALGWESYGWLGGSLTARATNAGVIALTAHNERTGYFRQQPVGMKSGGRYRFSAEVRAALPEGAQIGFLCHPSEWNKDVKLWFPANTGGKWQRFTAEFAAPPSASPEAYAVGFIGAATKSTAASLEIRGICLTALDDESDAAVRRYDVSASRLFVARIVPIDPVLGEVRQKNAEITFYWPGDAKGGVTNCTLSGVLMQDGKTPGKRARAKFSLDARAKLAFGVIGAAPLRYRLDLQVTDGDGAVLATNAYWMSGRPDLPQGPAGRRLNNFVTELVNADLKDGTYDFFRPCDGWVWISFDRAARTAIGYLDDRYAPVIAARRGEPAIEQMCFVTAGWHHLRVRGAKGGRLRVHQVKRLEMPCWEARGGPCDFSGWTYEYSFPFVQRYLLNAMNTTMMPERFLDDALGPTRQFYASRGFDIRGCIALHFYSPLRNDGARVYQAVSAGSWVNGWSCVFDENRIYDTRHNLVEMSEVLWRMAGERPKQALDMFWGDATNFSYDDPAVHAAFLSAVVNSGGGRGLLMPEVYAAALSTPEETDKWIDLFAQQVRQLGELVPGARDRTCFHISPYVNVWSWNDEPCPETDIKAHYSRLMHTFATDPRFAENAGLSSGASNCCEEELRRWHARCQRYYGIEGGTNDLARQYGYVWNPGLLKNPDFADGLDEWTPQAAQGGEIRADRIAGYGRRLQRRMKIKAGTGDGFAEFTATEAGANRLSQKMTGFVPGRFYALRFCVANRANTVARMKDPPPSAFSASLDGGEMVDGLCYRRMTKGWGIAGMTGSGGAFLFNQRLVFKAKAREITLTFIDRGTKGEKVPAGTRQIVNFVFVRPYYCESPDEPREIAELLTGNEQAHDASPRPSPRSAQLKRISENIDCYGIVHWGLNTYTDREWGFGDENPALLNPTNFDADQIVASCKAGGLQGLIVVAKHHDGFCLWPTKTTRHNIAASPFRGGKGDYVREMEQACRRHGLKFGVYVSPWDRNNAHYAAEKYVVDVFQRQIAELLSGDYGEIFEMWFDGANGGDGYYGGAREKRKISTGYYRYATETFAMVRRLQPDVCIFNEMDEADFRFGGNERGEVDPDSRSTGGHYDHIWANYQKWANVGQVDGTTFHPIEADFPLRPGWFYHEKDRGRTKPAAYLMKRYLNAVGNAATLNLGISPNREGRLDDEDVRALKGFGDLRKSFFAHPAGEGEPFNLIVMREDVTHGEMVDSWRLLADGRELLSGRSIGIKRIRTLARPCSAAKVELNVRSSVGLVPSVTLARYLVDTDLLKCVLAATTESGETDTAKWMTGAR